MQVIFYHNKSGEAAYTGELKTKEVHKAITLHPVKQPEYLYKLHTYIQASNSFSADLGLVNWHNTVLEGTYYLILLYYY